MKTKWAVTILVGLFAASLWAGDRSVFLRDDDGGRAQVVKAGVGDNTNPAFHGGTVIQQPQQYSIFLGSGWADTGVREREAGLLNLGSRTASGGQSAIHEDFSAEPARIGDLQVQHMLAEMIASRAIRQPARNTIYVVFLAPGVSATLDSKASGGEFVAYHNFFHLRGSVVRYVVVPFEPDGARHRAYAQRAFTQAANNPLGDGWY